MGRGVPNLREETLIMREAILRNKNAVMEALAGTEITSVVVQFDAYGDDGQMASTTAQAGEVIIQLPATPVVMVMMDPDDEDATSSHEVPLPDAIEMLCCAYLEDECCGWEIDEGSYGTFTFTVSDGIIELDFTRRVSEAYRF